MKLMSLALLITLSLIIAFSVLHSRVTTKVTMPGEKFEVTLVPPDNGTYMVSPEIPSDGRVPAGTRLTIRATPSPGFALDAIYYSVEGGMWGMTHFEDFTSEMQITVDKRMWIGANFIEEELVKDLSITHDVVYAKPGVKPLKYDVFAPREAENLPCIVIVHGGGWSSNNEDIMRGLARELTRGNRYVVFSIDYRWINNLDGDESPNYMHHLIEDVLGAIAHIQENAHQYGGDPGRIAVTGDSAGGHLSAAAAVLCSSIGDGGFGQFMPSYIPQGKNVDQVRTEILQAVKAAAPSYGPFDASDFSRFLQQTDQAYYDAISPIKHVPTVNERSIPHFIVRGTEDFLVSNDAVQPYVDVLKSKGQKVEYIQVEGAGHAFFDWKPDERTRKTFMKIGAPYAEKMRAFFDEVLY